MVFIGLLIRYDKSTIGESIGWKIGIHTNDTIDSWLSVHVNSEGDYLTATRCDDGLLSSYILSLLWMGLHENDPSYWRRLPDRHSVRKHFIYECKQGRCHLRPGWSQDHPDLKFTSLFIYNNLKFFICLPFKKNLKTSSVFFYANKIKFCSIICSIFSE